MQRNFEPMQRQLERWRAQQVPAEEAKLTIYRGARGIRTAYDVESIKRIYFGIQGTGPDSAI